MRSTRSMGCGLLLGRALLLGAAALPLGHAASASAQNGAFDEARIFIEFNSSDNDLGFHVFLDGEDWKRVRIVSPTGRKIFETQGGGGYKLFGMTELFFEGAEPSLDEVDLDELLSLFPEGIYTFSGTTVDGEKLVSQATLTHAIPDGPVVSAEVDEGEVTIRWDAVTTPPGIEIVGYQVIVGSFQVTLPASSRSVEVPEELIASLDAGEHGFEVLAIEVGGNQTITQGDFELE